MSTLRKRTTTPLVVAVPFLLLLALANFHLLQGKAPLLLAYDHGAVLAGEWWRLFTHPLVHVSWRHLILDALAVSFLWDMLPLALGQKLLTAVFCGASSLGFALVTSPLIGEIGLCGLSGIAHGLMAAAGWLLWRGSRDPWVARLGILLLAVALGKGFVETWTGASLMGAMPGDSFGVPIVQAHLGGSLGGIAFAWLAAPDSHRLPGEGHGSKNMRRILVAILIPVFFACICLSFSTPASGQVKKDGKSESASLSPFAQKLINDAYAGFESNPPVDHHTHILGSGENHSGNFVNPAMLSARYPAGYVKFKIYSHAAGIKSRDHVDSEYLERLLQLAASQPVRGKFCLLAFDKHYRPDGTPDLQKTEFYVSNDYVFSVAEKYPDLFIPVMSVHPYRQDALEELDKWAAKGGRIIKWLPNAMGMDPADQRCVAYYRKMVELNLVLLSHGGDEKAVEAEEDQALGDPERLKLPLDMGVKVIVAHCASLGEKTVVDASGALVKKTYFDIFMEMLQDAKYEGLLYGDISAMTQANRDSKQLATILMHDDIQKRLVNGSDYPLPAVNVVIWTRRLQRQGFITSRERIALGEIYRMNPLLFDFVLKRTLHAPGTHKKLRKEVFTALSMG